MLRCAGVAVFVAGVGDPAAVGRELGESRAAAPARDAPPAPAGGRRDPDVGAELARVPLRLTVGRKRDRLAVGRPGGMLVEPVAVGDLRCGAGLDVGDEDVGAPLVKVADAVEAVAQVADDARRRLLGSVLLLRVLMLAGAGDVGEAAAVGRPRGLHRAVCLLRQLASLAAIERRQEHLVLLAALGDEREPAAVGRPSRRVIVLAVGEAARGGASVERRDVDRHLALVGRRVVADDGVGDEVAVGRDLRVEHLLEQERVGRLELALLRCGHGGRPPVDPHSRGRLCPVRCARPVRVEAIVSPSRKGRLGLRACRSAVAAYWWLPYDHARG